MNRRVNHEWLPGETLIEHNLRLEDETKAYKTTVHYRLWEIRMHLSDMKRWAVNSTVSAHVDAALHALENLNCQDFGEDENGCMIFEEEQK